MANRPADRLKLARVAAGYRYATTFSSKFSVPQSTYSMHESGERGLDETTATFYAEKLGNCSAAWLLTGEGRSPMTTQPKNETPPDNLIGLGGELRNISVGIWYIVGAVEAGSFRAALEFPPEEWEPLYVEERPDLRGGQRFGLRVRGPSMNAIYPPGTILDCVKFIGISRRPRSGDHVIVTKKGPGDLIEATVKELVDNSGKWELWPRSNHPAYRDKLDLGRDPGEDDQNEDLRIVALVIGSYSRRT